MNKITLHNVNVFLEGLRTTKDVKIHKLEVLFRFDRKQEPIPVYIRSCTEIPFSVQDSILQEYGDCIAVVTQIKYTKKDNLTVKIILEDDKL